MYSITIKIYFPNSYRGSLQHQKTISIFTIEQRFIRSNENPMSRFYLCAIMMQIMNRWDKRHVRFLNCDARVNLTLLFSMFLIVYTAKSVRQISFY